MATFRLGLGGLVGAWTFAAVVIAVGLAITYQFVEPAPPSRIVLATGEPGGAYDQFGARFAQLLVRDGIRVELRQTAGSAENLELLSRDGGADLAFVQGGLADRSPTEGLMSIGTMYLEPLWLFLSADLDLDDLAALESRRVAVGAAGSGTRAVVTTLLRANGVDETNSRLLDLSSNAVADGFAGSRIDAAFLIGDPSSRAVAELVAMPGVKLHELPRAEAYTRRYSFLSTVVLPRGVLDLRADRPPTDIRTVAPGAMLVVREGFHPALTDLLLVAAREIHGGHTLLADVGQFPTPRFGDLPLSAEAERHFRHGPPFLMRYLPFWAATLVDRLWIMLLPLIGLSLPLVKLVPPAYRWQIRRRLLRIYSRLGDIDPLRTPLTSADEARERLEVLDQLEAQSTVGTVPRSYTDDVYKLRRDIDLVRRRLTTGSSAGH